MRRGGFLAGGAAAAAAGSLPLRISAATPTVKIGYVDSFSGPFSDIAAFHRIGVNLALQEANRSGRIRYELLEGDDTSKPANGTIEARRLIDQEKVDVLMVGTSSATALALSPLAETSGVFLLCIGPQDTSICGTRANRVTFRFAPNVQMFVRAIGRRILAVGKKWYFIQADYAFGKDAYNRFSALLRRAGGTEVGLDVLRLGNEDFSSALTKVRNSGADQLVLCQGGLDVANTAKQFVDMGLHKKMRLAGVTLEDFYYKSVPLDELAGSTFGVIWTPDVSPGARKIRDKIARVIHAPVSLRHYIAYVSTLQLVDRLNTAGTTKAEALVAAFANHAFDAGKANPSQWRGCDHQCIQDVYAGSVVGRKKFAKTQYMFDLVGEVAAPESAGTCADADASAAEKIIAGQKIPERAFPDVKLR